MKKDIIYHMRNLKGKEITVETKDKKLVTGTLKKIDRQMNIMIFLKRDEQKVRKCIKGTNVRYVIFNDEFSIVQ